MKNLFCLLSMMAMSFAMMSFKNAPVNDEIPVGGAHLVFAGKYGGKISKSELTGHTELKVDGCAKGARIYSYALVVYQDEARKRMAGQSQYLTKEMVTSLMALRPGDSFEFVEMKAFLGAEKEKIEVRGNVFEVI